MKALLLPVANSDPLDYDADGGSDVCPPDRNRRVCDIGATDAQLSAPRKIAPRGREREVSTRARKTLVIEKIVVSRWNESRRTTDLISLSRVRWLEKAL
jgi:hypothetical protein